MVDASHGARGEPGAMRHRVKFREVVVSMARGHSPALQSKATGRPRLSRLVPNSAYIDVQVLMVFMPVSASTLVL